MINKSDLLADLRRGAVVSVAVFVGLSAFWVTFKPNKQSYNVYSYEVCDDRYDPCHVIVQD